MVRSEYPTRGGQGALVQLACLPVATQVPEVPAQAGGGREGVPVLPAPQVRQAHECVAVGLVRLPNQSLRALDIAELDAQQLHCDVGLDTLRPRLAPPCQHPFGQLATGVVEAALPQVADRVDDPLPDRRVGGVDRPRRPEVGQQFGVARPVVRRVRVAGVGECQRAVRRAADPDPVGLADLLAQQGLDDPVDDQGPCRVVVAGEVELVDGPQDLADREPLVGGARSETDRLDHRRAVQQRDRDGLRAEESADLQQPGGRGVDPAQVGAA